MYAKRIIPCLDVKNGRVVKGVSFVNLRDAGDPVECAVAYDQKGADELVLLDITATHEGRGTMVEIVTRVANSIFIPFTVGGGISSVEDFTQLLRAGADKISVNSAAVRNPLRMAYGVLYEFDLLEHPGAADALLALGDQAEVCDQMIERGLNTPYTSSVGRLFDAASALLGVCRQPSYDGQPAIELEAAMGAVPEGLPATDAYHIDVVKNTATETSTALDTSVLLFDAAPAFKALLDDIASGVPVATIARRFHDAFVNATVMAAQLVQSLYGITTVALSGGVFLNRYLLEHAVPALQGNGFTVALNRDLPPSDGCISYGQAVVAWAARQTDETAGK